MPETQKLLEELRDLERDSGLGERIQKLHHCCLALVREVEEIGSDHRLTLSRLLFNTLIAAACEEFGRLAEAYGVIED